MKHESDLLSRLFAPIAVLALAGAVHAAPPQVVRSKPKDGDTSIDASLREIRIEFDQDMDQNIGYSICGGGPSFPKIIGKPKWSDSRVLLLRVKLKPGTDYVMNLNCSASGRYFRSVGGVPAAEYPIRFRTGSRDDAPELTAEENRESVAELRHLIESSYSYRELRTIDWDALFAQHAAKLERAKTPGQFAQRAGRMLAKAKDVHIWLDVDGTTYSSHKPKYKPNYSLQLLPRRVEGWREHNNTVATGRLGDDVGYILVRSWSQGQGSALDPVFEALERFSQAKGLIIDVRPNGGGSEMLAREVAGCFVDSPVVYSKNVNRVSDTASGFSEVFDRVVAPNPDRPRYKGKVAVLMGPGCMSSCESFLLMMKQAPRCTLVGGQSYGSSGNPKAYNLPNGVTVYLPSWKDLLPDGTLLEGKGVEPDVPVKVSKRALEKGDPVLAAALEVLRR